MRATLSRFQEETGNHYNLEATPAEGTGYRLSRLDSKRFPDMRTSLACNDANQTPIYSNSTQLPVNYSDDIFKVLELQDELQTNLSCRTNCRPSTLAVPCCTSF